jgi:hypothetical protein
MTHATFRRLLAGTALAALVSTVALAAGMDRRGAFRQAETMPEDLRAFRSALDRSPAATGPYFQDYMRQNDRVVQDMAYFRQQFVDQFSDQDLRDAYQSLEATGSIGRWRDLYFQGQPSFQREADNTRNSADVRARWRALLVQGERVLTAIDDLDSTLSRQD